MRLRLLRREHVSIGDKKVIAFSLANFAIQIASEFVFMHWRQAWSKYSP